MKKYSAEVAYQLSKKNNTDGKARCGECMKKAGTRRQTHDK